MRITQEQKKPSIHLMISNTQRVSEIFAQQGIRCPTLKKSKGRSIPYYACRVRAGFPSPADDYIESHLDLNEYLIAHPAATFFVRASGDSMIDAGIGEGDLLVVDRSIAAAHGHIVIAAVNGELTVKRLSIINGITQLMPENKAYPPLVITESLELVIWGVVIHAIRSSF